MIIKFFFKKFKAYLIITALLSITSAAITTLLLSRINNLAVGELKNNAIQSILMDLALLISLLILGASLQYFLARLGGELVGSMRSVLSQQLIELKYEKMINNKHIVFGSLIQDVANIAPLVLIFPLLVYNVLLTVIYATYLSTISLLLLGTLVAFLSISALMSLTSEKIIRGRFDALRDSEELLFEHFRAISDGKKELSLNEARASHFIDKTLEPAIQRAKEKMIDVHMRWGFKGVWSTAIMYGSIILIIYIGYVFLAQSQTVITHFVIGTLFLIGPVNFIIGASKQVGTGMASLRHLEGLGLNSQNLTEFRASSTFKNHNNYCQSLSTQGHWELIRIDKICYHYPNNTDSSRKIGPISLELRYGEITFITGGNGSGKSTLLLLLCNLLTPESGQIFIDDRPVKNEPLAYQSRFTGVFGDFFIFPDIIDANGKNLSDLQIEELLIKLNLNSIVTTNQSKLSKLALSSGQRKRIALLQCYAEDRDIFFFDEWAADQDTHFREHFYCVLLPELKRRGKTIFVISHDDRYFCVADRIIKLDNGLVVMDYHNFTC